MTDQTLTNEYDGVPPELREGGSIFDGAFGGHALSSAQTMTVLGG